MTYFYPKLAIAPRKCLHGVVWESLVKMNGPQIMPYQQEGAHYLSFMLLHHAHAS
jgi:hypothetical protein